MFSFETNLTPYTDHLMPPLRTVNPLSLRVALEVFPRLDGL